MADGGLRSSDLEARHVVHDALVTRFEGFLRSLRLDGYPVSIEVYAAAAGIFVDEFAHSGSALTGLKHRLTPLFARDEKSQRDVAARIDRFIEDLPEGTSRERAITTQGEATSRRYGLWALSGLAVLLLLVFALAYYRTEKLSPPEPKEAKQIKVTVQPLGQAEPSVPVPLAEGVKIQPQTEIQLREPPQPHPWRKYVIAAALIVPLLAAMLWWWFRLHRRRFWMSLARRGVNDPDVLNASFYDTEGIPITNVVNETGAYLNQGADEASGEIDMPATVIETIRALEDLRIVEKQESGYADYIVLIERKSPNDHLARIVDNILDRIDKAGVTIRRYYYRDDPRYARPAAGDVDARSFDEMVSGFGRHRFVVMGSTDGFFHPITGELNSWGNAFDTFLSRTVLNARAIGEWSYQEDDLLQAGFTVGEASPEGMASYGVAVSAGTDTMAERLKGIALRRENPPEPIEPEESALVDETDTDSSPRVFISYRRADSGMTVRIHDHIEQQFGIGTGLPEVDGIPLGTDFADHVEQLILRCDVVLVIIGPGWLGQIERLQDKDDFVRIEMSLAFQLGKPVLPILLDGSGMPSASELPDELKSITRRNAISLAADPPVIDGYLIPAIEQLSGRLATKHREERPNDGWSPRQWSRRLTDQISHLTKRLPAAVLPRAARLVSPGIATIAIVIFGAIAAFWLETWLIEVPQEIEPEVAAAQENPSPFPAFTDCTACPEMIELPGGTFVIGSPPGEEGRDNDEGPQREVKLQPFALARNEVTFEQWQACVDDGGCKANPDPADEGWGRSDRPVINVSWRDAQEYIDWLNTKIGGNPYRLPTEAEWEYAARAGTTTPFAFGETITSLQANYDATFAYGEGTTGVYRGNTVPVFDLSASNAWGFRHMHGNVWEWTQDCYFSGYSDLRADGSATGSGKDPSCPRVVRGGSWSVVPQYLRSAGRDGVGPDLRYGNIGFRPARTLFTP